MWTHRCTPGVLVQSICLPLSLFHSPTVSQSFQSFPLEFVIGCYPSNVFTALKIVANDVVAFAWLGDCSQAKFMFLRNETLQRN